MADNCLTKCFSYCGVSDVISLNWKVEQLIDHCGDACTKTFVASPAGKHIPHLLSNTTFKEIVTQQFLDDKVMGILRLLAF